MPLVSVLLPVYNTEKYISESIQSIINQTFKKFELLIIDDGSTDNSLKIINTFKDKRIRIIRNEKNLGLIKTLNKGIDLALGKYIARMDADDIAHPQRLEKQFHFLEKNPQYALVGTQANFIWEDKVFSKMFNIPTNDKVLKLYSFFSCPFIHPSVMVKTNIFKEFYYQEDFTTAEDYELWTRILRKYQGTNLSDVLLSYRLHHSNISNIQKCKQIESIRKIYQRNLEYIEMPYTNEDLEYYLIVSGSNIKRTSKQEMQNTGKWLIKMRHYLNQNKIYESSIIENVFSEVWYSFSIKCIKSLKLSGFLIHSKSPLSISTSLKQKTLLLFHTLGQYSVLKPIYEFLKTSLYNSKY